ncbi:beta-galactosidase [Acidovorax sp. 62]|uniref:beta-galactosidase n=1 Tax=Acidovorax sp. 62 TaxID=2035203 RepID=UPI001E2B1B21|nr:beta-galactosidase [Acidovorax sp. 62]
MNTSPSLLRSGWWLSALAASLAGALGAGGWRLHSHLTQPDGPLPRQQPMVLAPMIGVIEPCILPASSAPQPDSLQTQCSNAQGSAAALVEATLRELASTRTTAGVSHSAVREGWELGYTLPVPLLQLFKEQAGGWQIDQPLVDKLARTVRDSERPVVVYLFATHFASHAPLEQALAADPRNLAQTRDGPMPAGKYYGEPVYYWNIADPEAPVNLRRREAAAAMVGALCALEPRHRSKIRAVTLLGEVHHYFPDFEQGMGFVGPYRVTDYSPASQAGFQDFLRTQFGTIEALNQAVGGSFASWEAITPPSKDIRTEPLAHFNEHIDSYAQGVLPVSGWAFRADRAPGSHAQVLVYRNGELAGRTPISLSRQDVLQAKPEFGEANTGWRVDLDFRHWPAGLHRLDFYLQEDLRPLLPLGTRQVAIMDRQQATPLEQPLTGHLPQTATQAAPAAAAWQAHIDSPAQLSSYYYNPLVPLWHTFRAKQVARYIEAFGKAVVQPSCLHNVPTYTHQIVPFSNPGWDAQKFAVEESLAGLHNIRLGVSLYGEASYGDSFGAWYAQRQRLRAPRSGPEAYGVTEFHPLKGMDATEWNKTLQAHQRRGAAFLSFFMEPRWEGQRVERGHNIFSIDPENQQFRSDALYRAAQQTLEHSAPGNPGSR